MESLIFRCARLILVMALMAGALVDCAAKPTSKLSSTGIPKVAGNAGTLLDFESPDPAVAWKDSQPATTRPAATTEGGGTAEGTEVPAPPVAESQPADPAIGRSSVRPNTGLWALQVTLTPGREGALLHRFDRPRNLEKFSTISAAVMHLGTAAQSGQWRAAVYLVDADGKRVAGDAYAVTSKWRDVPLDLRTAEEEGLDLMHVVEVGVEFLRPNTSAETTEPLAVQTDTWRVETDTHAYVGQKFGAAKSFYVQREGTRLEVGMVGQYEVDFFQRAGTQRPWFTIRQKGNLALGQPGPGLMLLDQDQFDGLGRGAGGAACGRMRMRMDLSRTEKCRRRVGR
jgi:hypothetical protein